MTESSQWRIFVGVGVFIAVIAVIYWFVSYEAAGTVMLGLSAALALFSGTFLWRHQGSPAGMPAPTAAEIRSMEPYLPRTSVWPLIVGVAAALCLNGLVVGWPYAVPGVVVLALGIVGWVGQSRRRA